MNRLALALLLFGSSAGQAALHPAAPPAAIRPRWMLSSFLELGARHPHRLLQLAERLFADERLRMTTLEARLSFEWQHRLAMVSALSAQFEPTSGKKRSNAVLRKRSRELISRALLRDPSLLVRDGSVEAIRRIVRMQPGESKLWQKPLEQAFLDKANAPDGEGYFIRETLLTALHEAGLRPSAEVRRVAERDRNPRVKSLLKQQWDTRI